MKRLLLPLLLPLLLLGGCASIPPEALSYSTALKAYHKKSSAATLLTYESSVSATKFTLENFKAVNASRSNEYVAACQEASGVFAATQGTLREVGELLELLPGSPDAKQAEIRGRVDQKLKALQDKLTAHRTEFDKASKDAQTRSASDTTGLNGKLQELEQGSLKLKALIVEGNDTTADGLARQEALLASYLNAQARMKKIFGAHLTNEASRLTQEASQLAGKVSPLLSTVDSILK